MFDVRKLTKEELLEIVNRRAFDVSEYNKLVQKFVTETHMTVHFAVNGEGTFSERTRGIKVKVAKQCFESWILIEITDPTARDWILKVSGKRFGLAMNAAGIPRKRFNDGYRYLCRIPTTVKK